jgi:hypothetical protein
MDRMAEARPSSEKFLPQVSDRDARCIWFTHSVTGEQKTIAEIRRKPRLWDEMLADRKVKRHR